jgi:hypothetical protein
MKSATIEKPAGFDEALEAAIEGEMREFVRRDVVGLKRAPETESDNIGTLLQRVAGTSMQEIDRLIAELQTLRSLIEDQRARVERELAEYAQLSQTAMQSTKIIAETLAQWQKIGDPSVYTPH